jgi:hypothetical protein
VRWIALKHIFQKIGHENGRFAMSIIRVGTTKKYSDGWDAIFGKKGASPKKTGAARRKGRKKTASRKKK